MAGLWINQDELELTTHKAEPLRTSGELVKALDEGVAEAREALANTTDEHLMKPWRLLIGGSGIRATLVLRCAKA